MPKYYDLTTSITEETVVFPGDPCFEKNNVAHVENDEGFELQKFSMSNHLGTHIDFPAHIVKGGKTSSEYNLEKLVGNGLILEIPDNEQSIKPYHIDQAKDSICHNDFVFFKTFNSNISKQGQLAEKYIYLEPETAQKLVEKGVSIVGIDYISVDHHEHEDLPVHHTLLSEEVLIVENLELKGVPAGRCQLYIVPLKIPDMDGLPTRVFMENNSA